MDKVECRRSLGIPEDAWVIASFGFVTQSKRIPVALAAFKRLLGQVPNAMFLVVGKDHRQYGVARLIEKLELRERARLTGYIPEREFFRYLKAVDVAVNLRYPTAGETSGTLIRALGSGLPVIVTDFGQFADLPDDVCLKIAATENEERELYLRLRALALRPALRERLSRRSAEWIRAECEISRSAARYLDFIESHQENGRRASSSGSDCAAVQLTNPWRGSIARTFLERRNPQSNDFRSKRLKTLSHL
jgi:glycosyltransferase involved in cell wall biosynthesis